MNESHVLPAGHPLQALAAAHADFAPYQREHPELAALILPAGEQQALSEALLAALSEMPEQAARLQALREAGPEMARPAQRFDGGVASIPVLVAVAFLLRTHIKIERREDGKVTFEIRHKPGDGKLLGKVLEKLERLLD